MALWNEFLPEEKGDNKPVKIIVKGLTGVHSAVMSRLDSSHGSLLSAYAAMGKPVNPTQIQIAQLRRAGNLARPEKLQIDQGRITTELPPQGLALIEIH